MDTVFLALRVIVSLGAVFGALFFAHRWITKGRPAKLRGKYIGLVARQGLGAKAGVAIVDAGGRRYLLGVTEHAVTVLDHLGPAEAVDTGVVAVVSTAPVPLVAPSPGAAPFERELARATAPTGGVPVVVGPGDGPSGPPTQTILLPAAASRAQHPTRRAALAAEHARALADRSTAQKPSPLAGSVLSPETWRQTITALRRLR